MNLLFDQNISFRLINKITKVFPVCKQVKELSLDNSTDLNIWHYAKKNDYCIVTYDSDFIDLSNLLGYPPKIIWLRIGNTSTSIIAERLIKDKEVIAVFLSNTEDAFLEIK
jgi:predicted nuclease of predicted toxin-antitoxin system